MSFRVAVVFVVVAAAAANVLPPYVSLGGTIQGPSNYSAWLALGGRGLDSALQYGDDVQGEMAAAITSSKVGRSEIFLTTKVPCCPAVVPELSQGMKGTVAQHIAQEVAILGKPVDLLLLRIHITFRIFFCAITTTPNRRRRTIDPRLEEGIVAESPMKYRGPGLPRHPGEYTSSSPLRRISTAFPSGRAAPGLRRGRCQGPSGVGAHHHTCGIYPAPLRVSGAESVPTTTPNTHAHRTCSSALR